MIRQDNNLSRLWCGLYWSWLYLQGSAVAPSGFAPRWSFLAAVPASCGATHSMVINQGPLKVKRLRIVSPRTRFSTITISISIWISDFLLLVFLYYLFNAIWLYRCHKFKIRMRRCRGHNARTQNLRWNLNKPNGLDPHDDASYLKIADCLCLAAWAPFPVCSSISSSHLPSGECKFCRFSGIDLYLRRARLCTSLFCFIIHWKRRWRWWGRGDVADDVVVVLSEIKQKSGQSKKRKKEKEKKRQTHKTRAKALNFN